MKKEGTENKKRAIGKTTSRPFVLLQNHSRFLHGKLHKRGACVAVGAEGAPTSPTRPNPCARARNTAHIASIPRFGRTDLAGRGAGRKVESIATDECRAKGSEGISFRYAFPAGRCRVGRRTSANRFGANWYAVVLQMQNNRGRIDALRPRML